MRAVACAVTAALVVSLAACEREARIFRTPPSAATGPGQIRMVELQPGKAIPGPAAHNPDEENAYAVSQGKRLFRWYNCNGCHSNGGGGMGPPLMDNKWIYGSEPANIYATIIEGRPNGMPSFGGHIPPQQVWQLVAYVRSMSGLLRSDVAPSRNDGLQAGEPENRRAKEPPKPAAIDSSARQ